MIKFCVTNIGSWWLQGWAGRSRRTQRWCWPHNCRIYLGVSFGSWPAFLPTLHSRKAFSTPNPHYLSYPHQRFQKPSCPDYMAYLSLTLDSNDPVHWSGNSTKGPRPEFTALPGMVTYGVSLCKCV